MKRTYIEYTGIKNERRLSAPRSFWFVFKNIIEHKINYLADAMEYMGLRGKKSRHNGIIKAFVRTEKHLKELVGE